MRTPAGADARPAIGAFVVLLLCRVSPVMARPDIPQARTVSVRGAVTAGSRPLAGAEVIAEQPQVRYGPVKTDSQGQFVLNNVVEGRYTFIIALAGFDTLREARAIPSTGALQFALTPTVLTVTGAPHPFVMNSADAPLTVAVVDANQQPKSDVWVELFPNGKADPVRHGRTDANGKALVRVPNSSEWDWVDVRLTDESRADSDPSFLARNRRTDPLALVFRPAARRSRDELAAFIATLSGALGAGTAPDIVAASAENIGNLHRDYLDAHPVVRGEWLTLLQQARIAQQSNVFQRLAGNYSRFPLNADGIALKSSVAISGSSSGESVFIIDRPRFNSLQIDGATAADMFGLAAEPVTRVTIAPIFPLTSFFGRVSPLGTSGARASEPLGSPLFSTFGGWRLGAHYTNVSDAFTGTSRVLECNCPQGRTGYRQQTLHDVDAYGGGPVAGGRGWVQGIVQYRGDRTSQPGTDPLEPAKSEFVHAAERSNWTISRTLTLWQSYDDTMWTERDTPTVSRPASTLATYEGRRPTLVARLQHVVTNDTTWHAEGSRTASIGDRARPNGPSAAPPWRYDLLTGSSTGGSYGRGSFSMGETAVTAGVAHFSELFGRRHDLQSNVRFVRRSQRASWAFPAGVHFYDVGGEPSFVTTRRPALLGARTALRSLDASDDIALGWRLTVNVAGRYDHIAVTSPDLQQSDEAGDTVQGLGSLADWSLFSGGLGFRLALDDERRVTARGLWRAYRETGFGQFAALHPGNTPLALAYFTEFVAVRLPQGTPSILVRPPGARRFDNQRRLDIRLSRAFRVAERDRLELIVTALNLLNAGTATDVSTGNVSSKNFGAPSRFVAPRRIALGIRIAR